MMRDKLGLFGEEKNDKNLIKSLMDWMSNNKADYTNTFCYLMGVAINDKIYENVSFKKWLNEWKVRSRLNNSNKDIGKKIAAEEALNFVHSEMVIGLGTGSTAKIFVDLLSQKYFKENLILKF